MHTSRGPLSRTVFFRFQTAVTRTPISPHVLCAAACIIIIYGALCFFPELALGKKSGKGAPFHILQVCIRATSFSRYFTRGKCRHVAGTDLQTRGGLNSHTHTHTGLQCARGTQKAKKPLRPVLPASSEGRKR